MFIPSTDTNLKNHKGGIFIQHFFKIILYWCLDLIRLNIDIPLKHNKYIFDIPICHHLYLSGIYKQCFTGFANTKATRLNTSEELHSQWITILKMQENVKSPITPTKIVESKWWYDMINYTSWSMFLPNRKSFGSMSSEEFYSQSITILKMHENVKFS